MIAGGVPLWEMAREQQEAVLEGNLQSVLVAARVGIPALLRRPEPRSGRFVAVASAAATRGLPMLAAYCAAKAGVTGLVRALAAELRGTGVTANAVSPGSTATPILDESARLYGLESAEAFSAQQPLERLIRPEEVAAAIVWLTGPAASAVTGAAVPVDGGLSLQRPRGPGGRRGTHTAVATACRGPRFEGLKTTERSRRERFMTLSALAVKSVCAQYQFRAPVPLRRAMIAPERHGRLDILVNNAAAPQALDRNVVDDVPVDAFDEVIRINLRGTG